MFCEIFPTDLVLLCCGLLQGETKQDRESEETILIQAGNPAVRQGHFLLYYGRASV